MYNLKTIKKKLFLISFQDDEFFDCHEVLGENSSLAKWSSMELTPVDQDNEIFMTPSNVTRTTSTSLSKEKTPPNFRRVQSLREQVRTLNLSDYSL